MDRAKPAPCINCKRVPEITEQDGEYRYILKHPDDERCYPIFKLETHQHTKLDCIKKWNNFNAQN